MAHVTGYQAADGHPHAAGQFLPLVNDEFWTPAAVRLAREKAGQTPQPTTLDHEASRQRRRGRRCGGRTGPGRRPS